MAEEFESKDLSGDTGPSDDDKLWVFLTYIFTPLIPIVIMLMEEKKNRSFIRAHNAQALVWGLINTVLSVTLSPLLCGIPSLVIWGIGVYWGYQGYQGQTVQIPVISDFVQNQGWA
jgi:uncharacterized protein